MSTLTLTSADAVRAAILVVSLAGLWVAWQKKHQAAAWIGAGGLAAMFATTLVPPAVFDLCRPKSRAIQQTMPPLKAPPEPKVRAGRAP